MGWKPIHFGLAGMMLIFGSFNTLSVKWADTMKRWALVPCVKQLLTFAFIQRVGGRHNEALQPPLPTGIFDKVKPSIWTCSYWALLTRPVVCSWARCSAWWPSGSQPATEDEGQREVLMLILVQRKRSQDRSAPWSSSLQRYVIWPQPLFNT